MKLLKGIWIGFWSGLVIGFLLKWIQSITGVKVYSLLLNVDFIPIIGSVNWSEPAEFSFHIVTSLIFGIIYVYLAKRRPYPFGQLVLFSLILCVPLYLLYFPLAVLAVNPTLPGVADGEAILYWIFAHLAYALALPILYKIFERKNAASQ
ncbi:hypothetical protein QWY14_06220 [Planococcus sp. N028]|uniref:DUF1440 domain-containing protein n=1 Tax=Planococcus shixiaomingii TaxID=3058393 RepID=A0ABT8N0F7_9BACL|nr:MULTISPECIES: hypothetical protein [unclassified Planococcus (in: firmicutes)]MDN7241379.1 hypothetical protein [Planococcus sp. N028]WKA53633.1 hypothetical protein QWY21_13295 [Planococcus sp. N022]